MPSEYPKIYMGASHATIDGIFLLSNTFAAFAIRTVPLAALKII